MNRSLMVAGVLTGALTLAAPAAVQGQEDESPVPEAGTWSIATRLPDGGGQEFGLWRRFGDRINLGLEIDFRYTEGEDDVDTPQLGADVIDRDQRTVLGPTFKYYLTHEGPVVAFARATVARSLRDVEVENPHEGTIARDSNEHTWIYRLAIGADFFPVERVAVGFFTGLVLVQSDLEVQVNNVGTLVREQSQWNTFTSGLQLQYFF